MEKISATTGWNNTSSSFVEGVAPSKAEGITFCIVFALETVFVVVGNLFTLVLFAGNKNLRKKSLFLVINMTFADVMLGAMTLPFYIYRFGGYYQLWTQKVQIPLNIFFSVMDTIFSQASLTSAAVISVERCYAIYWPLRYRTLTMKAYRTGVFIVWTLAAIASTVFNLHFTSTKHSFYAWAAYSLSLLFIVCGCNIGIWRKFQHGRIASHQQNSDEQSQRLTKTLLLVSIIALLSWLPLIILNLLYALFNSFSMPLYLIANIINYSNSFVNPIVYALRIPEFRQGLSLRCFGRRELREMPESIGENNVAAALTPVAKRRTLPFDPNNLELAVLNSKLWIPGCEQPWCTVTGRGTQRENYTEQA